MPGYDSLRIINLPIGNGNYQLRKVAAMWFSYSININFTVAAQVIRDSITLLQDSFFELCQIVDNHANPYTIRLTDGSSSREMMNQLVPIANIAGTAVLPYTLPDTYIFRQNGNVVVEAVNGAVAANPGTLTLLGARLFDKGAA